MNINNKLTFAAVALGNFAANASIGTASATVDIAPAATIPQTTAGITLTIPNPTINEIGSVWWAINTGTVSVTVGGVSVGSGKIMAYLWSGTAWQPLPVGGSKIVDNSDGTITITADTGPVSDATSPIDSMSNFTATVDFANDRLMLYDASSGSHLQVAPTKFNMTGATSAAAGAAGFVPQPAAGQQNQFLTGGATYTSAIPSWVTAKAYAVGDVIYDPTTNKIYRRTTAGTSLGTFALDSANWQELSASSGAEATTASNGLTLSTLDVQLGGTLTKNTSIDQAGFTLNLTNTGTQATGINLSNSAGNGYLDIEATGNVNLNSNHRIQFLTNGTTRAEFLNAGTFLIEGTGAANTSGLRFANLSNATPGTASAARLGVDASGNVVVTDDAPQVTTVNLTTYYTTVTPATTTVQTGVVTGTVTITNPSVYSRLARVNLQAWAFMNFYCPDEYAFYVNYSVNGGAYAMHHNLAYGSFDQQATHYNASFGAVDTLEYETLLAAGASLTFAIRIDWVRPFIFAGGQLTDAGYANATLVGTLF